MHSGKKAQCILVKSDEFENRTPFYILQICFIIIIIIIRYKKSIRRLNPENVCSCMQVFTVVQIRKQWVSIPSRSEINFSKFIS